MTTPAPPQQQQQQKPPPKPAPAIPPQTLAAMALPLAGLLLTAVSAAVVVATLKLRFKLGVLAALFWLAMLWVLARIVMHHPPQPTGVSGVASEQVSRLNAARRAQFVISATERVMNAMLAARAHGEDVTRAGEDQVERERRYYQMHLDAMRNRAVAAAQVDMMALEYGPLLGWYAKHDSRATAECLAADHHNFYVDDPPAIGLPGIGPHVGCRCEAGPPWPGGKLLPGSGPRYARAA